MNTAWFCVAVVWCFVLETTDADVTEWTEPVIANKDGSGNTTTPVAEGETTTFPLLAATNANNYVITSQTPSGIFQITASSGQLALNGSHKLDFETSKTHVLVVKANDGSNTGTATITINITDVNDNPPLFTESTYAVCVVDKAKAGTSVLTVSTTDVDTTTTKNAISAMTILAGDTNSNFAIAINGTITLTKVANMTATASYTLTVKAADSDSPKLTGTTTVSVTVADKCDGGGGGVGVLAASLLTMLLGVMTSLSSL